MDLPLKTLDRHETWTVTRGASACHHYSHRMMCLYHAETLNFLKIDKINNLYCAKVVVSVFILKI